MTSEYLSGVLIIVLGVALSNSAQAQRGCFPCGPIGPNPSGAIIGAIVGVTAALVVVTVVVIHETTKKRAITGCVALVGNAITLNDERDKQTYALSGDTTSIKPGDRMKLRGRKVKSKQADKTIVWEMRNVAKDFGACQPKL